MGAVSEFVRTLKKEDVLYLVTLPVMVVLVILSFKDAIPNLVDFLSRECAWLFS
jgi:hypothetical protein